APPALHALPDTPRSHTLAWKLTTENAETAAHTYTRTLIHSYTHTLIHSERTRGRRECLLVSASARQVDAPQMHHTGQSKHETRSALCSTSPAFSGHSVVHSVAASPRRHGPPGRARAPTARLPAAVSASAAGRLPHGLAHARGSRHHEGHSHPARAAGHRSGRQPPPLGRRLQRLPRAR